jgi:hypothetical protein
MKQSTGWFVYVIQEAGSGHIKVGYAQNPVIRLSELQTGNPHKLSIVYTEEFKDEEFTRQAEKLIHNYLQPTRLSGEWFEYQNFYHDMIKGMEERGVFSYIEKTLNTTILESLKHPYRELLINISSEILRGIKDDDNHQLIMFADKLKERSDLIKKWIIDRRYKIKHPANRFPIVTKVTNETNET